MSGIDRRRGMTLIEVLIAMTMTLIVLGAMMAAFRYASGEISKGRAMIELSNQLRIAQEIMRTDLEGVTVDMRPWAITAGPNGYFEYIEGVRKDYTANNLNVVNGIFGDVDDVIAMTVRGKEFHGRDQFGDDVTSNVAEVIWWVSFENRAGSPGIVGSGLDYDESVKVFRRQLLVLPQRPRITNQTRDYFNNFQVLADFSVRFEDPDNDQVGDIVFNSLEDLAKRENRYCHHLLNYPQPLPNPPYDGPLYPFLLDSNSLFDKQQTGDRLETAAAFLGLLNPALARRFAGNDVMISDVVGFDVQVYSPNTVIQMNGGLPVAPSDIGYNAVGVTNADQGTFVDLGWSGVAFDPTLPEFSTLPNQPTGVLGTVFPMPTLDTFSKHYESNGVNDDNDFDASLNPLIDEATNGLDDDLANGVDDNGERETLPPYPFRIAGIKVSFRIVERTTKQVRQTSVVHSFLPK
ncbi:MAG: prepilin-type N-terminal cleavage/methylation domain-containing protein [Pirellulaceae bacterium]